MKKNNAVYIVFTGLLVAFVLLFFWRQTYQKTLLDEISRYVDLTPSVIGYRSVGLSMGGNTLLFYKPELKEIPFPCAIDKMSLSLDGNDIRIGLNGVSFNVNEALRAVQGDKIALSLKNYTPYTGIWKKPLESLALAGVEDVKLNAHFTVLNKGLSRQLVGEAFDKKLGKVIFDFSIPNDPGALSVDALADKPIIYGIFSWEDVSLIEPYRAYAKSIGYEAPINALTNVVVK